MDRRVVRSQSGYRRAAVGGILIIVRRGSLGGEKRPGIDVYSRCVIDNANNIRQYSRSNRKRRRAGDRGLIDHRSASRASGPTLRRNNFQLDNLSHYINFRSRPDASSREKRHGGSVVQSKGARGGLTRLSITENVGPTSDDETQVRRIDELVRNRASTRHRPVINESAVIPAILKEQDSDPAFRCPMLSPSLS